MIFVYFSTVVFLGQIYYVANLDDAERDKNHKR